MNITNLITQLEEFAKKELNAVNIDIQIRERIKNSDLPPNAEAAKTHHKGEKYAVSEFHFCLTGDII